MDCCSCSSLKCCEVQLLKYFSYDCCGLIYARNDRFDSWLFAAISLFSQLGSAFLGSNISFQSLSMKAWL
jgi:hypothetical protein